MKKILLLIAGLLLLAIGMIGIFFPVLPTTPFVIAAALCFSGSSRRLHSFLLKSKIFGPYIENYRTGQGVPLRLKATSIVALWVLLLISALIMHELLYIILFVGIGVAVTIHLLMIKTKEA